VNEEGQGRNAERDLAREPPGSRPGDIVIQPAPAVINLREELPKYVAGLSTEQRTELLTRLRSGHLGELPIGAAYGEELAKLIEPAATELANRVRSVSFTRSDIEWLIGILIAVLLSMAHHDPPPPNQTVFIEHHETTVNETTVINLPPAPIPPTGERPIR